MPRILAVDLGSHSVKVAAFKYANRSLTLDEVFVAPVPQDGDVPPPEAMHAALDSILEEHLEWKGGTAGTAMQADHITLRRMSLPFTDKAQVEKTLPFAIEGEVPFDLEEMTLGWRIRDTQEQSSTIMAALVRNEVLESVITPLAERQLDPERVFIDAEVLGVYCPEEDGQLRAVIDIGHRRTLVTVVRDGVVVSARAINTAGWQITVAIQEAMSCTWEEAERLKHGAGGTSAAASGYSSLPVSARQKADQVLGTLLAEIRTTLIGVEDTLDGEVHEVRVCGGTSRIPELVGYLKQDLGLAVYTIHDPVDGGIPAHEGVVRAIGYGLAGQAEAKPIDLRIGEFVYTGGSNPYRLALQAYFVLAAVFCLVSPLVFGWQYYGLTNQLAEAENRQIVLVAEHFPDLSAAERKAGTKLLMAVTERVAQAEEIAAILPDGEQQPQATQTLAQLSNAFPKPEETVVDMTDFTFTPTNISFKARTDGYASSASIMAKLQSAEQFERAVKSNERKNSKQQVTFDVSIPLGDEEEVEEEG